MAASCRTYRLQNIVISRKNVMQLGWSAGVPKKEPLRLGSSVVAGTQMMGNALLVRVSLRAASAERALNPQPDPPATQSTGRFPELTEIQ